jgi:hypothetical protein
MTQIEVNIGCDSLTQETSRLHLLYSLPKPANQREPLHKQRLAAKLSQHRPFVTH